jgi:tetratricopeptide (TPR) repeat protein
MERKNRPNVGILVVFLAALSLTSAGGAAESVRIWEEPLVVPTYLVDEPDPNPVFYFGRAYQGAQGPVYPYPFLDRLTDRKVDKSYQAVYLENEFLKICVLPELGGRIFSAVDKTNGYDFVYRQHVIKPALIGMLGAWISGGVEWNIPHHHRATTFMEVVHLLEPRPDGSATVWVGEIELRDRMKWLVGLTVRPGRSSFEVTTRILNRTPLAHSMLAFANVAVHANPDYQVIFPPDVEIATFHAKNQFSRWPWSTERFNGQDYTRGVDVSWWKSHTAPTSFFAWEARGDFLAGYDHGRDAGIVFTGDHNFAPGKKLWTWGTGSEGRLWERVLTDTDGPYAELMVGAWSDNQPDYSWISPYEVRSVSQQWYPIRGIGSVKEANGEAACSLAVLDGGKVRLGLYSVTERPLVRAVLSAGGRTIYEDAGPASPRIPFVRTASLPEGVRKESLSVAFLGPDGKELVAFRSPKREGRPLPPPVRPPVPPSEIRTVEELYLTGLRIEQFRSAAAEPYPYYEEALRRDPGDYRTNTALGLLYMKRAMYADAERVLRTAVERATKDYTRPKDGEALYYLGVAFRAQGKAEQARDAFNRSAWTQAWRSAAFIQLAEMAGRDGDWERMLTDASEALETNARSGIALGLRAAALRRLGRPGEAATVLAESRAVDPMDFTAAHEAYLLKNQGGLHEDVGRLLRDFEALTRLEPANHLELAADYTRAGMWPEAAGALKILTESGRDAKKESELARYYLAWCLHQSGDEAAAAAELKAASSAAPGPGFPFQAEMIDALRWAMSVDPKDARAPYQLGNSLFDLQPDAAMRLWETSAALDPGFSIVLRNIGVGYWRTKNDIPKAREWLARAVAAGPADARHLLELDQVLEIARVDPETRLGFLEKHHAVVERRDDALGREIRLLVLLGRLERAIELLKSHHFRVWEGGGNIHGTFVQAYLMRGRELMDARRFREALGAFETALTYPANLDAAEPRGGPGSARVFYHIGLAQQALGSQEDARKAFERAIRFGRTAMSEDAYYRGLAFASLGRSSEAAERFTGLVREAEARVGAGQGLPAQTHFCLGLGLLGQGKASAAAAEFKRARELEPYDPEIKYFCETQGEVR